MWGSAAGALLSWDAIDFGQRKAAVDAARAQSAQARARIALTEIGVAGAAADAFLSILAADAAVRAARANVDRFQVLADSVHTLVANQLRAGADESRANAELAITRNQVSRAAQAADIARATLPALDAVPPADVHSPASGGGSGGTPPWRGLRSLRRQENQEWLSDVAAVSQLAAACVTRRGHNPRRTRRRSLTSVRTSAGAVAANSTRRAFQSRFFTWSARTTPVTLP